MDVEIKQTVGVIHVERNASPFLYLMPCRQRDVIYCLHENGCVSVRAQQAHQLPTTFPTSVFDAKVLLLNLMRLCSSGVMNDIRPHIDACSVSL